MKSKGEGVRQKSPFSSPRGSFIDIPSVGAQSPSELQSPLTVGPDTQPTEDISRVFLQLLSVLMHSVNTQERREEPCVCFAAVCHGSSTGLRGGCYRWAVSSGVLLHHMGCRHLWQEGLKAAPRRRRVQSERNNAEHLPQHQGHGGKLPTPLKCPGVLLGRGGTMGSNTSCS